MYKIIKNKTIVVSPFNNGLLENRIFVNCIFQNITGNVNMKNILFVDCVFEKCKLYPFMSTVQIYRGKIDDLRLFRANICDLKIKKCLVNKFRIADSFMERVTFKENDMESLNITTMFTLDSSFISNKLKNMRISNSSFSNFIVNGNIFKEIDNIIERNFFDSNCEFKDTDFSALNEYRGRNNYLKNTVLGTFKNCQNKDRLGVTSPCPTEGSFIGYKKCWYDNGEVEDCIVTLKIYENAKRLGHNSSGKCRCNKAKVISIETMDGEPILNKKAFSLNDSNFIYEIGKIVKPTNGFDENEDEQCSSGIHFFMTKEEARNY